MTTVPGVVYRGLAYGGRDWVVAGELGTILTSADGINWTQRFSGDLLHHVYELPSYSHFDDIGS